MVQCDTIVSGVGYCVQAITTHSEIRYKAIQSYLARGICLEAITIHSEIRYKAILSYLAWGIVYRLSLYIRRYGIKQYYRIWRGVLCRGYHYTFGDMV